MSELQGRVDLENRVAIVTGAGRGLGRQHALMLARHGARVVVNDVGGGLDGEGNDEATASQVVEKIVASGGEAVADFNSVTTSEGGEAIVETALRAFDQVDIVVNNAGILRDKTFHSMTNEFLDPVLDVHLRGAFNVTRPAWKIFRSQGYGRVINTSSASGVLGNFGQANYGAAKAGLIGFTHVLALEGARYNITANAIAPVARTRMTEDVLGKFASAVSPELVSPLVVWLSSSECTSTSSVFTVGGGRVARFFTAMTDGWTRTDGTLTAEDVRAHWEEINDQSRYSVPDGIADDFRALRRALRGE